jgi:hypothetical protein
MQLVGFLPWILLAVLLVATAPKIRTSIVGWILMLAGVAVFGVRLHHEGPYPSPGAADFTFGCAALFVGALLIRSPWIVTGRGSRHDHNLTANPRVEIFRRGEARCWRAERHLDRTTLETLLQVRSEKYRAQRIAFATRVWKHFSEWDNLDEIAVALRFEPCQG